MQWYRIGVNKIPPNINTLFATSFYFVRLTVRHVYKAFGGKGIMAIRRGLSCNDVLVCLDVLSDVDSEHEDDIEDSLSWDESDPSEISACESDSEEKQDGDSREILGKDAYLW